MLLAYFYFHHVLDKIPTWKLFTLTLMEKSKAERSRWVKKTKKMCCNAMLLAGNLDLLSQTLEGSVVALVCGFIRRELVSKSRDGASCKKIYAKVARDNTSTFSEFIGYADSTDFREISPNIPEIILNQQMSGNFDI